MIEIKNHQYFRQEKWAWHVLDSATPMSFDIFFLIVVISLCINQIDIVGVVYSWFSDCHALLLQYSEFSSSNRLNIFKVFIYRVNNQRVMTTKLLKHMFLGHSVWPEIQQTKMLVTCQRFGDLFLSGLVWQYSNNQNQYNIGRFKFMATYLQQ